MNGLRRPHPSTTRSPNRKRWSLPILIAITFALTSLPPPSAQAAANQLLIEPQLGDASLAPHDTFAERTAMDGNRLVVQSRKESGDTVRSYRRQGGAWVLDHTFTLGVFVFDLALSGNTLAVAGRGAGVGKVELYELDSPAAAPTVLNAPAAVPNAFTFANSVALDGNRLVVGGLDIKPLVYERSGGTWPSAPTTTLPEPELFNFASVLKVSGNTVLAGGESDVRVLAKAANTWSVVDRLSVFGFPTEGSAFLLSGDTIVVAVNQSATRGTLEVRTKKAGKWPVSQTIAVPDGITDASLNGSDLAVVDRRGKVQLYAKTKGTWVAGPSTSVAGGKPETFATSGLSVSTSDGKVAVGQPGFVWGDPNRGPGRAVGLHPGNGPVTLPNPPTQVKATFSTSASAKVTWKASSGPTVTRYRVQLKSGIDIIPGAERYVSASTRSATFDKLVPLAPYWFSVRAVGPGGESAVAKNETQYVPGPAAATSPLVLKDPAKDVADARLDLTVLKGEANGDTFTVTVRTAGPRNPYSDAFFHDPGDKALVDVTLLTPAERRARFQHVSNNQSQKIVGEDFTFRFMLPRPHGTCGNAIVPARYVDGNYQASIPVGCFDHGRALRLRALTNLGNTGVVDQTSLTKPIKRVTSTRGNVQITSAKASSPTVWAKTDAKITISATVKHSSGIKRVILMPFNIANDARPVRVGAVTCKTKSASTKTCSATFVVRPGELRDQDSGLWRVFAQVQSTSGAATVDENAVTFSVRRGVELTGAATVTGSQIAYQGHLSGARWNKRGYSDLAKRPVRLQRKAVGSSSYTTIRQLTTDADGNVSGTISSQTKGTWRLSFAKTQTYAARSVVIARTR